MTGIVAFIIWLWLHDTIKSSDVKESRNAYVLIMTAHCEKHTWITRVMARCLDFLSNDYSFELR